MNLYLGNKIKNHLKLSSLRILKSFAAAATLWNGPTKHLIIDNRRKTETTSKLPRRILECLPGIIAMVVKGFVEGSL